MPVLKIQPWGPPHLRKIFAQIEVRLNRTGLIAGLGVTVEDLPAGRRVSRVPLGAAADRAGGARRYGSGGGAPTPPDPYDPALPHTDFDPAPFVIPGSGIKYYGSYYNPTAGIVAWPSPAWVAVGPDAPTDQTTPSDSLSAHVGKSAGRSAIGPGYTQATDYNDGNADYTVVPVNLSGYPAGSHFQLIGTRLLSRADGGNDSAQVTLALVADAFGQATVTTVASIGLTEEHTRCAVNQCANASGSLEYHTLRIFDP